MAIMKRIWWPLALLGVIWVVQVVNLITGYALNSWLGFCIGYILGAVEGIRLQPHLVVADHHLTGFSRRDFPWGPCF